MPTILDASADEARRYLMESGNYVNFDLPHYYDFQLLLDRTAAHMGNRGVHEFFRVLPQTPKPITLNPKDIEGVNYKLIGNKDGEFAWRPFEIIHPALYVALVNDLTSTDHWALLRNRFSQFQKTNIRCESMPYISEDREKHKAHQIKRWWENVEQESLRLSLRFGYVYDVDITDCYGSVYTHSLAWALHGKHIMKEKKNRTETSLLGNRIDWSIQKMRHGQTNGIPQGSTLMDFIAEILLGYIDLLLTQRLDDINIYRDQYYIIRFRDDYKIFTNNPELGRTIVKELSGVLSDHGLKLNTSKTKLQADPVVAAIKPDKLYELFVPNNKMTMSKRLMQIYKAALDYPNSGIVTRELNKYYLDISRIRRLPSYDDSLVMMGIITNLAIKNPKSHPLSMAILSQLMDFCSLEQQLAVINDIRHKFSTVPNTGMLDIWLQRVTYKVDATASYKEKLTKIVSGVYQTNIIWGSSWLEDKLRDIVMLTPIVIEKRLKEMPKVIQPNEVVLFKLPY